MSCETINIIDKNYNAPLELISGGGEEIIVTVGSESSLVHIYEDCNE